MKGSVLIADDEPLARRTLRQHLLSLGWTGPIHEAQDGRIAIAIANGHRPDLVFLDIVMPGATGLEIVEHLDYEPKVIFTTAHDQYAVTEFELGALDYLLKIYLFDTEQAAGGRKYCEQPSTTVHRMRANPRRPGGR